MKNRTQNSLKKKNLKVKFRNKKVFKKILSDIRDFLAWRSVTSAIVRSYLQGRYQRSLNNKKILPFLKSKSSRYKSVNKKSPGSWSGNGNDYIDKATHILNSVRSPRSKSLSHDCVLLCTAWYNHFTSPIVLTSSVTIYYNKILKMRNQFEILKVDDQPLSSRYLEDFQSTLSYKRPSEKSNNILPILVTPIERFDRFYKLISQVNILETLPKSNRDKPPEPQTILPIFDKAVDDLLGKFKKLTKDAFDRYEKVRIIRRLPANEKKQQQDHKLTLQSEINSLCDERSNIVNLLRDIDIKQTNRDQQTIVHILATYGDVNLLQQMVEYCHINPNQKDINGKLALDLALESIAKEGIERSSMKKTVAYLRQCLSGGVPIVFNEDIICGNKNKPGQLIECPVSPVYYSKASV